MTGRDHPTQRAAHRRRWRLDRHDQAGTVLDNPDHVQAGQPDEQVAAITVGSAARAAVQAARRLDHRQGPRGTGSWSFLILRTLTLKSQHPPHRRVTADPTAGKKSPQTVHAGLKVGRLGWRKGRAGVWTKRPENARTERSPENARTPR